MAVQCRKLVRTCRKCGLRFERGDEREVCDCGESRRCNAFAVQGYALCKEHGGPVPSRNFYGVGRGMKTGEHSRFQITRLASKYMEVQGDGPLLSNRYSIEIIRHRIKQLAERIDMSEAPQRMEKLQGLWKEYSEALEKNFSTEAELKRKQLDEEFEAAYHDYMSWKQMFEAVELDKKLTESEVKILKDLHAMVSVEEVMQSIAKVMAAVMRVVNDDPKKMKQVEYEFTRIIGDAADGSFQTVIDYAPPDGGETVREGPGDVDRE